MTLARTPLKKRRQGPKRRTLSPRCSRQRCGAIARIGPLCVRHAEIEADTRFSVYVRKRDGRCTAVGTLDGLLCSGPLQAAHIVGRRNQTMRYNRLNVWALCAAHHMHVDQYGSEAAKYLWAMYVLGSPDEYDDHMLWANTTHTDRTDAIESALAWLAPSEGERDD